MDRPFVGGGDEEYEKNYDRIFRKSLKTKIKNYINHIIFKIFLEEGKK